MRGTPMWEPMLALTYTVKLRRPVPGRRRPVPARTRLLASTEAPSSPSAAAARPCPSFRRLPRAVAEGLPKGEYQELEGGFHEVPAATLAPVIADFIRRATS